MKIATAREMAEIDRSSCGRHGLPVSLLMERAGTRVAQLAGILLGGVRSRRVTLVCGRGNNGGDGFVAARVLLEQGALPVALLAGDPDRLRPDARQARDEALRAGVEVVSCPDAGSFAAQRERASGAELVVDALLGTGFSPPARGVAAVAIEFINGLGRPVIAVDLPSGLASDHGRIEGPAVRASATVTFGYPKPALVLLPAAAYAGRLWLGDLGFPAGTGELVAGDLNLLTAADLAAHLAPRDPQLHKGSCGRVLIVAGSRGLLGAAVLCARGALRAGAGLVTAALPASVAPPVLPGIPEAMTCALPDGARGAVGPEARAAVSGRLAAADALALGPGLSRTPESAAFVAGLAGAVDIPLVLDADALQALADTLPATPSWRSGSVVLTPHPGEMARLLGVSAAEVQADRVAAARACAARFAAVTVLKGARTVVAAPEGRAWVNPTGNAGMAAAGMGDVLTGVIAAHLARGLGPLDAALFGVHLHGLAGDLEALATGPWGLLASSVADRIPAAVRRLAEQREDRNAPDLSLLVA